MLAIATNIHVLLIVRDLEGGPNCRVSELLTEALRKDLLQNRYKRVVRFAYDSTTRTL